MRWRVADEECFFVPPSSRRFLLLFCFWRAEPSSLSLAAEWTLTGRQTGFLLNLEEEQRKASLRLLLIYSLWHRRLCSLPSNSLYVQITQPADDSSSSDPPGLRPRPLVVFFSHPATKARYPWNTMWDPNVMMCFSLCRSLRPSELPVNKPSHSPALCLTSVSRTETIVYTKSFPVCVCARVRVCRSADEGLTGSVSSESQHLFFFLQSALRLRLCRMWEKRSREQRATLKVRPKNRACYKYPDQSGLDELRLAPINPSSAQTAEIQLNWVKLCWGADQTGRRIFKELKSQKEKQDFFWIF